MPPSSYHPTKKSLIVYTSMAMESILSQAATIWNLNSPIQVNVFSKGGAELIQDLKINFACDVTCMAHDSLDELIALGLIDPTTLQPIAISETAIAIPIGHSPITIDTANDLKMLLLSCEHIGYSTGPSGHSLISLLKKWGMYEVTMPKLVQALPGTPVGWLVAQNKVDVGFQQLSELINMPDIHVLGTLPSEVKIETVFSVAMPPCHQDSFAQEIGQQFINFLGTQSISSVIQCFGMRPIHQNQHK